MTALIFIVSVLLIFVDIGQGCTIETAVNCTDIVSNSTIVLQVFGMNPTNLCNMVQIGNTKYVYDPIMINSAWITLVNQDGRCITDLVSKAQFLYASLNNLKNILTEEIVIIKSTPEYDNIILLNKGCLSKCQIIPFSAPFENILKTTNNMTLYPIYNNLDHLGPYCLNGGVIDATFNGAGYKCTCPEILKIKGPRCEVMERRMNSRKNYFNVFESANNINITFSLLYNATSGTQSILFINNNNFREFIKIIAYESDILLLVGNEKIPIISFSNVNHNWLDFYLKISQQEILIMINSTMVSRNITMESATDFRSFYLVLDQVIIKQKICIKNLFVNKKVIDLNGPAYESCCNEICPCTPTQSCECNYNNPKDRPYCYCPYSYGYICSEPLEYSQINDSVTLHSGVITGNKEYSLYFGFRTLSVDGNILTIRFRRTAITLSIQIINSHLVLYNSDQGLQIINYKVSDGRIHSVLINIKKYSLELVLDNNMNYTTTMINWFNSSSFPFIDENNLLSFSVGEMKKPYNNSLNNLTTCISLIQLKMNNYITNVRVNSFNGPKESGCKDGPKCIADKILCSINQVCKDDEWQNTKCICIPYFSSVNSSCVYHLCIINPCNSGICYYNSEINSYSCNCNNGYSGRHCETIINKAQPLWIAILVVLLLLLSIIIILLIYCFCPCYKVHTTNVNITKVYENVVVYNDQAGESDYNGPPLNMTLLFNALNENLKPNYNISKDIIPEFIIRKNEMERDNDDLVLDHPLEYGYEGYHSDDGSISSIGSKSQGSEVDVTHDINSYI